MKRVIGYGVVALLLATAVGCKKDKKKADEAPADDKAGEMAGDKAGEATEPAPAGGDTATAGGDTAAAGGDTAAAGGTATAADVCKKLEELATKEGGKGLEKFNSNLKDDCEKDLGEEKTKNEAAFQEFAKCIDGKASFTDASKDCTQIN